MEKNTATLECNDCEDKQTGTMAEQIARAICDFQHKSTGHTPTAVSVVLSEDTLVITLHEALTPAEKAMAKSAGGAAKLQEFHRQLFASSSESLRQEIKRISGRQVREAAAEVEPTSGSIVHAGPTHQNLVVNRLGVVCSGSLPSAIDRSEAMACLRSGFGTGHGRPSSWICGGSAAVLS